MHHQLIVMSIYNAYEDYSSLLFIMKTNMVRVSEDRNSTLEDNHQPDLNNKLHYIIFINI